MKRILKNTDLQIPNRYKSRFPSSNLKDLFRGLVLELLFFKTTRFVRIPHPYNISVGNMFWLPIGQFKFFGTIKFLVSIYGKILVILSPNLVFSYRSLHLPPFVPWKISPINLWKPRVKNHHLCLWFAFSFLYYWTHHVAKLTKQHMPWKTLTFALIKRIK